MTLYSFSRRSTFKDCPAVYFKKYVQKVREPKSDAMLIGIAADEMLEALVAAVLNGTVKNGGEIVDYLKDLVTDVEEADGVVTSIQTSALWTIERGLDVLANTLQPLAGADTVETQEMLYFDDEWNLLEQEDGEDAWGLKRRATWGGDLDLSWITGSVGHVRDWKTGASKWSKPQQVEEYQALMHLAYDGLDSVSGGLIWLKENKPEGLPPMKPGDVGRVIDTMEAEALAIEHAVESGDFVCRGTGFCSKGCKV